VPSFDKQKWFTSVLHEADNLSYMQTGTMVELEAILPSILDRAFQGGYERKPSLRQLS
jgi:hypothetical protein